MKKIFLITILFFCFSCDSSDDGGAKNDDVSTFEVSATQDLNSAVIDQIVTITANTDEPINSIDYSIDGGVTFSGEYSSNFGNTAKLYLDFDTVGTKNIVFRIKNNAGNLN